MKQHLQIITSIIFLAIGVFIFVNMTLPNTESSPILCQEHSLRDWGYTMGRSHYDNTPAVIEGINYQDNILKIRFIGTAITLDSIPCDSFSNITNVYEKAGIEWKSEYQPSMKAIDTIPIVEPKREISKPESKLGFSYRGKAGYKINDHIQYNFDGTIGFNAF